MGPEIRYEQKRGCGYREVGGPYLVADGLTGGCEKLPLPLRACPVCGGGVRPSRGWTWWTPAAFVQAGPCGPGCIGDACPLFAPSPGARAGLLWVGGSFYSTPRDVMEEAASMGVSRRISAVPRGFELGKAVVFLAHRRALYERCNGCGGPHEGTAPTREGYEECAGCAVCGGLGWESCPGVFAAFRPTAIEQVVEEDAPEEECERLRARGIMPVAVRRLDKSGTPEFPVQERLAGQDA